MNVVKNKVLRFWLLIIIIFKIGLFLRFFVLFILFEFCWIIFLQNEIKFVIGLGGVDLDVQVFCLGLWKVVSEVGVGGENLEGVGRQMEGRCYDKLKGIKFCYEIQVS